MVVRVFSVGVWDPLGLGFSVVVRGCGVLVWFYWVAV